MTDQQVIFEQPLNEAIRICLRTEHLYLLFERYCDLDDSIGTHGTLEALLELLKLADRPDFKSKLSQQLAQYTASLSQMERHSSVDRTQLQSIREELERYSSALNQVHGRFGETLRHNEFINSLRMQFNTPGGICDYAAPSYLLWRKLDTDKCEQLREWFSEFSILIDTVKFILRIARSCTSSKNVIAEGGFYQQTLDATVPCHMIRVGIPSALKIYPEISVGRHRLSIHFLIPDFEQGYRHKQHNEDVEMELICCYF